MNIRCLMCKWKQLKNWKKGMQMIWRVDIIWH